MDECADEFVAFSAHPFQPAPGAPPPEVASQGCGQDRETGGEQDRRREELPHRRQLRAFGAEHRAQDRVEGDAHHRRQRGERRAHRPRRQLAGHFLFDDLLVDLHPLAVQWWHEQFAPGEMRFTVEAERGTRADDVAEVGDRLDQVSCGEQFLDQVGIAEDDAVTEERQRGGECRAVALAGEFERAWSVEQHGRALDDARSGGTGRQSDGIKCGVSHEASFGTRVY